MATETVADSNVNPWGLYVRELGFAATYTGGSIDAAEDLLLYALGEGWIRWLYGRLEFKDSACTPAQLEQVRKALLKAGRDEEMIKSYLGCELQFFWRPAEHTSIAVDRAKSEATRTGPPWVVGSRTRLELIDGKLPPVENYWPIFLTGLAPVTLTAKLFQLHHDDVVATLRRFSSPPPQQKEATPAELAANKKILEPQEWLREKYKADPRSLDNPKQLHDQMVADAAAKIVSRTWSWGKKGTKGTFQRRVREYKQDLRKEHSRQSNKP
jgi:hypothetical protein